MTGTATLSRIFRWGATCLANCGAHSVSLPKPDEGQDNSRAGAHASTRMVWTMALISGALLVPCFWHSHLQSVDLPSHIYNAWLYTDARAGKLFIQLGQSQVIIYARNTCTSAGRC